MVMHVRPDLVEHANLIRAFTDGQIQAGEFETSYLRLVKNDPVIHGEPAFNILDELFYYVDEYFDDPDFTEEESMREQEDLRTHAKEALEKLLRLTD